MGRLAGSDSRGMTITERGTQRFGTRVSLTWDKTLRVNASSRDCLEFAGSALRDWYREAMQTGQRFDEGRLPTDSSGWVGYDTGLLATQWRVVVTGNDIRATCVVALVLPDAKRAVRVAQLAKQGVVFAGLSGKALAVWQRAVATYVTDAVVAE